MTTSANDLEALETAIAELTAWLRANPELVGTPEFQKRSAHHKLLTDLRNEGGGTPEQRAAVIRKLNEDNPTRGFRSLRGGRSSS